MGRGLFPLFVLLGISVAVLVYFTGGVKSAYSHLMYLPILLSGFRFGLKGGLFSALFGGLLLGPFMPIDTVTGEMQSLMNWIFRTIFFTLVGALCGIVSDGVKSYINRLKWISLHDVSSRLPNRKALLKAINTYKVFYRKGFASLYLFSFENSDELRSAFGVQAIEESIKQFAHRFQEVLPATVHIFRAGFNEIAFILPPEITPEAEVISLSELIMLSRSPFILNNFSIHVDMRVGFCHFECGKDDTAVDPEIYLSNAESALIAAREKDLSSSAYTESLDEKKRHNVQILGDLKNGLERRELFLHYQPKISVDTGRLLGVESLLRWNHPTMGFMPPAHFIPRAEQSSLIDLITDFVLEESISQAKEWHEQGIQISMAANISARNLLQPDFVDKVLNLVNRYKLEPHYLELELTESSLLADMSESITKLKKLSENGITISIDDFGTGYSSLQYLHLLPVSFIKIDQSFALRIPQDSNATSIVDATITLAQKQGLRTIAEGVESQEIFSYLKSIRCDYAQGFWISKPLPAAEIPLWYANHPNFGA
jgi:EAL domain-containing protein (putative c-di-GMP-specific phosphodiesterase class I)/GGDEF domain-containing protein